MILVRVVADGSCSCYDSGVEYTTPAGLVVNQRAAFPRNHQANPNPPAPTVGPNTGGGAGSTKVMYPVDDPPIQAEAWDGWPVEWDVPSNLNNSGIAGKVSTVFAAIDLNARIAGSVPVYVKQGQERRESGPAWLEDPAPGLYYGWTDAFEQMWWTYQRRGEIFLWALSRYADGTVHSFAVLNPDMVDVQRGHDGYPDYTYLTEWDASAGVIKMDRRDVLFIPYARWPGELRGHSPLEAVAGNLETSAAASIAMRNISRREGKPWGVLNAPYELGTNEIAALQKQWVSAASRADGAPAIISGGFTLHELSVSPAELKLLEQQAFDDARVAVILGVQPYQLALAQGEGFTYSNVRDIYDYHWRSMLRPATRKIAQAISNWALPRGQRLHFNPDEYVRPGIDGRADTYAKLNAIEDDTGRVLSAGEIRDMEDFTAKDETPGDGTAEEIVTFS